MGKNKHSTSNHFHLSKTQRRKLRNKAKKAQYALINGDDKPKRIKVSLTHKKIDKVDRETERFQLLHREIVEFANKVEPRGKELSLRENTIKIFTDIMEEGFPNWIVKVFGSYSQGTQTIYSDLDFVVFKSKDDDLINDYDMLRIIKDYLYKKYFSYKVRLIKAKVPIIKATCQRTGINLDISVNRFNGCAAAVIINNRLREIPVLHPIILLLKMVLRKAKLNEPHTGGMGSFLLFSLVFFYYQRIVKNQGGLLEIDPGKGILDVETAWSEEESAIHSEDNSLEANEELLKRLNAQMNYGKFLNGFLKFCSTFDYENITVSLRKGGMFLQKKTLDDDDDIQNYSSLSVENFQDKNLNIGRSCYNFWEIQEEFSNVLSLIENKIASNDKSILSALNL